MSKDDTNHSEDLETPEETPEETSEETSEENTVSLQQYEKMKDDYLRLAADFDNYKKRTEKEKSMSVVTSLSMIISSLLPLIDNFEIAINRKDSPDEIDALYKMAQAFLDTFNVKEVPGVGEPFNPAFHEAVEKSGDGVKELVGEVHRKGYEIDGRLLRPAMVKVHSE
uniref:Protein GrpE n=1 Tax=Candidatus Actinomarina minuta TaxID=1389454 RepID=S5DNC4_9ACTN|nr:molecular chaperone GrpE (heat shock protein) [Candidatus Actinomarina minuta]